MSKSYGSFFFELNTNPERIYEVARVPIGRFFAKALDRNPYLADGDVFAYRDDAQGNVSELMMETHLPKCDVRAAKVRQEGNKLYQKRNFREALERYNESICWARSDSEDLAIGYANRSAIYYEDQEYEFAMANIALAKRHNYPQRLMPKLEVRELNCKSKIEAGEHKCSNPSPNKLVLNVEVNPRIPFLAKGIALKGLPSAIIDRSMVIERDFKAGDVILHEKPLMVSTRQKEKYSICQHCLSENFLSLIPCPQCVSAMYCSEQCLKLGWKGHRFECGISDNLDTFLCDTTQIIGSKMFFHGLTLFDDNVNKMMKCCKALDRIESNPLDWNYSDPLKVFKAFHATKTQPREHASDNLRRCNAAVLYTIYMQQPLVRSLFIDKKQQDFLLKYIFEYSVMLVDLSIDQNSDVINLLHPVASLCQFSNNPNAHAMYHSGQLKLVAIRPIRKGEQICIQYGALRKITPHHQNKDRQEAVWKLLDMARKQHHGKTFSDSDKMETLRSFIQAFGDDDRVDLDSDLLAAYSDALMVVFKKEVESGMRERIFADI